MEKIINTERIGEVLYSRERFYDALREFGGNYEPISFANLAFLRIKYHNLRDKSSVLKEGAICTQDKQVILVRRSPILNHPELAEERANNNSSYLIVDELPYLNLVEEDKGKEVEERRAIIIPDGEHRIPSKKFETRDLTRWLFQDQAKQYGDLLLSLEKQDMQFFIPSRFKGKSHAEQLYTYETGSLANFEPTLTSRIIGFGGQKVERKYMLQHIEHALDVLGMLGIKKSLLDILEQDVM